MIKMYIQMSFYTPPVRRVLLKRKDKLRCLVNILFLIIFSSKNTPTELKNRSGYLIFWPLASRQSEDPSY